MIEGQLREHALEEGGKMVADLTNDLDGRLARSIYYAARR